VRLEELSEPAVREHPGVMPGLEARGLGPMDCERVAEARSPRRHVAERERLPAEREGRDVVPARQVLSRRDREPSGPKQPPELRDERVRVREVFDDLIRDDHVERAIRKGKRPVQVRLDDGHPPRAGRLRRRRHELHAVNLGGLRCTREGERALAVVATEVEQTASRLGPSQGLFDVREVQRHGALEQRAGEACEGRHERRS
jgi:hypothetical protein